MSVSAITSAFASHAQQIVSGSTSSNPNTPAALAQEARETAAQTAKEAHNGDPVAKRKLLKLQAQQQQQLAEEAKPSEPGKGTAIDAHA